jgi:hypothetical protein
MKVKHAPPRIAWRGVYVWYVCLLIEEERVSGVVVRLKHVAVIRWDPHASAGTWVKVGVMPKRVTIPAERFRNIRKIRSVPVATGNIRVLRVAANKLPFKEVPVWRIGYLLRAGP